MFVEAQLSPYCTYSCYCSYCPGFHLRSVTLSSIVPQLSLKKSHQPSYTATSLTLYQSSQSSTNMTGLKRKIDEGASDGAERTSTEDPKPSNDSNEYELKLDMNNYGTAACLCPRRNTRPPASLFAAGFAAVLPTYATKVSRQKGKATSKAKQKPVAKKGQENTRNNFRKFHW